MHPMFGGVLMMNRKKNKTKNKKNKKNKKNR